MNLNQALDVLIRTHLIAIERNERPISAELRSGPGLGKSSTIFDSCSHLARATDQPVGLVTEMLATWLSVDVRGFMIPQKATDGTIRPVTVFTIPPWYPVRHNTTVFYPDGTYATPTTWDHPVPTIGIVFLDEFGQGEDDVKKASAELLLNGRVGNDQLPVGWRVIAASNRLSDRSGVLRSLPFITNRRMEINVSPDLDTWNDWVNRLEPAKRPHHMTISFANKHPDLVFRDEVPPGDAPFCTPRTLMMMDQSLQSLRSKEDVTADRMPTDPIAREVCTGLIGGSEAAQFFVHIKYADEIPDIAEIERDPMRAKLNERRDVQMVTAFMLAHHLTAKNGQQIMRYISRMNVEMAALAVRTISNQPDRAAMMVNNRDFSQWLITNKDVLIASHT
jgi:hypothetical protein